MMGEGLAVAVGALSFSDFALLGSASIVTGAVAAIGAALTRPEMVESLCLLTATLQTLWCVFPQTRRRDVSEPAKEVRSQPSLCLCCSCRVLRTHLQGYLTVWCWRHLAVVFVSVLGDAGVMALAPSLLNSSAEVRLRYAACSQMHHLLCLESWTGISCYFLPRCKQS